MPKDFQRTRTSVDNVVSVRSLPSRYRFCASKVVHRTSCYHHDNPFNKNSRTLTHQNPTYTLNFYTLTPQEEKHSVNCSQLFRLSHHYRYSSKTLTISHTSWALSDKVESREANEHTTSWSTWYQYIQSTQALYIEKVDTDVMSSKQFLEISRPHAKASFSNLRKDTGFVLSHSRCSTDEILVYESSHE